MVSPPDRTSVLPSDKSVLLQSSQKSRATFSEAAYTAEWTSIVCDFVKKQLAEITLPPAPTTSRPGFNIKAKLKPTLSDPEVRAKWTARFSYR